MLLVLLLMIIGFVTFQQREFKVSRYHKIDGGTCRMVGLVFALGLSGTLCDIKGL